VPSEVGAALHFVRVLMAVHQAKSPEEAKATFEAELQSLSSRAERFDSLTVDLAALVALEGGYHLYQPSPGGPTTPGAGYIYGLYAPFGVQVAWKELGGLIYPVDVGAYLTANQGGQPPKPASALRLGAALYWRIVADIPIVAGVAYDYRPAFEDFQEHRVFAHVSIELPLFIIH
jgi:hypothetical protein